MSDQDGPETPTAAQLARASAVEQATSNLVYLAIMVAVSVAITKRDVLTRLVMRARRWAQRSNRDENFRRLRAELRRDLSRIEHGDGPAPRPRGLYEQGGDR